MKTKLIEEQGKKYLLIQVPHNFDYGFISQSGKSFCYRVMGEYLKANGEVGGKEGQMSTYISKKLPMMVDVPHVHYGQRDITKVELDGILLPTIKVRII